MNEWISIKHALPINDSFVKVKMLLLFPTEKQCLFIKKYFIHKGENITKWVTHWMPLPEKQK